MMSEQGCFNLILNTRLCVFVCVCTSHAHTPAYIHNVFLKHNRVHLRHLSLSLFLSVPLSLSRPDMQEFEHELYIATQQPSSEPFSQTNNGQHDNSIMKWATWPPPSRGAVTLGICISMMPGLMVAPLAAEDTKKWIDCFSQATWSSEQEKVCEAGI